MVSVCVRAPPRSWWVFMSVGCVPRPAAAIAAAAVHMWMETRPDFLLLRPIRAAVSPAPDERPTQMRKHLRRFQRRPR